MRTSVQQPFSIGCNLALKSLTGNLVIPNLLIKWGFLGFSLCFICEFPIRSIRSIKKI